MAAVELPMNSRKCHNMPTKKERSQSEAREIKFAKCAKVRTKKEWKRYEKEHKKGGMQILHKNANKKGKYTPGKPRFSSII